MRNEKSNIEKDFKRKLKQYEEHQFGLYLYYETMPKALQWMNRGSIKRIMERFSVKIKEAKELLQNSIDDDKYYDAIKNFVWVPIPPRFDVKIDRLLMIYDMYPFKKEKSINTKFSATELKELRKFIASAL